MHLKPNIQQREQEMLQMGMVGELERISFDMLAQITYFIHD